MALLSTGPDRAQRKVSERGMGWGLGRPVGRGREAGVASLLGSYP